MKSQTIVTSVNLNDLNNPKTLYSLQRTEGMTWTNAPFTDVSLELIVFCNDPFGIQIATAYDNSKAYMRTKWGEWSAWKKITLT